MSDRFRSPETAAAYRDFRDSGAMDTECPLCNGVAVEQFTHWRVMENRFPYDRIAEKHMILLPERHVTEMQLTPEEREELIVIKAGYAQQYDYILEVATRSKSIPHHFHLHLIIRKAAT